MTYQWNKMGNPEIYISQIFIGIWYAVIVGFQIGEEKTDHLINIIETI